MQKRDVILTILHRVSFDYASPFLASLQRTGYRGEIVFFVSAMDDESISRLRACGVKIVPFTFRGKKIKQKLAKLWPAWRGLFKSRLAPETKERLAHAVFHLFYRRHLLYLEFLRAHRQDYDRIFLTDARDVFFQADPFAWNPPPGIHLFLEEEQIGASSLNTKWLAGQFGAAEARAMEKAMVSCAGTVFGDMSGVMQYLAAMVSFTMKARSLREDAGDQGIHNYLLYHPPFPGIRVHANRTGPVLTMGMMKPEAIRFNAQNCVVNDHGLVVPILHQYNRHPAVEKALLARLR